ncbi:helix-turn-helix transcriptional regulator [Dactylosporangium sp. NPDC049140]|uniref:helix-turn-helix domain-containing protein n=1 Tax=Dactylosporangium sp. NPDC049140 TaxID=3155647 RepID=UPI0033F1470C
MPRSQGAAVSRRRLRSLLRKIRMDRDMTQKEIADALEWSSTKVMRIEMGKVSINVTDLRAILTGYGVTDPAEVESMLNLARAASRGADTISGRYRNVLSKEFAEFLENEEAARIIRQHEPTLIPGPLQTREYATEIMRLTAEDPLPEEIREQRINARLERKAILTDEDGPQAFFIIDEAVLHRPMGNGADPSLMVEQAEHLREMAAYPNITIQVMPFSAGFYPALRSAFVLLEFEDPLDNGLLYMESIKDQLIVRDDFDVIARYVDRFQDMESRASRPQDIGSVIDAATQRLKAV